jgi:hypothetical protein
VGREHGELASDVRGVAVGAADLPVAPHELLEMRLALHAHVFVDRHGSDTTNDDFHRAAMVTRVPDGAAGAGAILSA